VDLNTKVEKSHMLIKEFAEKWNGVYIAFSGGKDSTALLLLAAEALPRRLIRGVVFVEVTGNTDRCNIEYVYSFVDRLGLSEKLIHMRREDLDFFEALVKWGVPMRVHRWCLNEFKMKVFQRARPPIYVVGVKHADSWSRSRSDWSKPKNWNGMIVFSPIWFWISGDIMDYLRSRNVPLSPCYRIYGHSGNCMYCPFRTRDEVVKTAADPYWGPKILSALSKLRNERGRREYRRWARHASRTLEPWLPSRAHR